MIFPLMFFAFFMLKVGWWLVPLVFFFWMMKSRSVWRWEEDAPPVKRKRKNDEQYIRTADGEWLEVVEEPDRPE